MARHAGSGDGLSAESSSTFAVKIEKPCADSHRYWQATNTHSGYLCQIKVLRLLKSLAELVVIIVICSMSYIISVLGNHYVKAWLVRSKIFAPTRANISFQKQIIVFKTTCKCGVWKAATTKDMILLIIYVYIYQFVVFNIESLG